MHLLPPPLLVSASGFKLLVNLLGYDHSAAAHHDLDAIHTRLLQASSISDADAAASRWAMLLEFVRDVTCSDSGSNPDEWVQLRANHAAQIMRALVATCYQISGVEVGEGGRCPRRVASRLILCAGRCLAAVVALSEASGWRLLGTVLLADVLETMRLGMAPLVNAWKMPVNDGNDAAAADDVAAYLGLCAQVCDSASSFIISSSSSSSTKKGSVAPAASHARAVLKLQVTSSAKHRALRSRTTKRLQFYACATNCLYVLHCASKPHSCHRLTSPCSSSSRKQTTFLEHMEFPPLPPFFSIPCCRSFLRPCPLRKILPAHGGGRGQFERSGRDQEARLLWQAVQAMT